MGLSRSKYRRVTDLFVAGTELVLDDDDTVLWVQALNPYEQSEARADAQAARARLVLALKEHGSDELATLEASFAELGRDGIIAELAEVDQNSSLIKVLNEIQSDPEWEERLEILGRSTELLARAPSDPERQLVEELNKKYVVEVRDRMDREKAYTRERLDAYDDETLRERFTEALLNARGEEVALAEYQLTEVYFGSRVCDARKRDDGTWDHMHCEGHRQRAFESKQEVRDLPGPLFDMIVDAFNAIEVPTHQSKGWGSQVSSSDSSRLPSEEEGSQPSTPEDQPTPAPGT